MTATDTPVKSTVTNARASRDARHVRRLLKDAAIRVFLPTNAHDGGVFRARKGDSAELLGRVTAQAMDLLIAEGALVLIRSSKAGRLYRAIPAGQRVPAARTARDTRTALWQAADRAFAKPAAAHPHPSGKVSRMAESPIGWLARRRAADGKSFLTHDEVAAAERLRYDFERSQMAPGVTQDWRRFLTSGVEGGARVSAQDRDLEGGAAAARKRLLDALDALGPGLSDVALRVCCFLEGIEAIETAMHWSRRSGKVVLKIALQRLAQFYEEISVRNAARIEAWNAESAPNDNRASKD